MFDVFVSYRHSDSGDVRRVAQALREAGLKVWFDESNIEEFASIQRGIEEGLASSKALLAWYSRGYPESLACQWELTRAFIFGQQSGDPRSRVLLVNPENVNSHIQPVELRDALYQSAPGDAGDLQRFSQAVVAHVGKLTGSFSAIEQRAKPRWFGAAAGEGSNRFFGRLPELWAIHSALWSSAAPVITNRESRPLVRVIGIGGSGKSLTAEVYAIRFGAAYPDGIFWLRAFGHDADHAITAEERTALRNGQLFDLAQGLGIQTDGLSTELIREGLASILGAKADYLWVVDDLPSALSWEDAKPWFSPTANGHTLITTRAEAFDWAGAQVQIEELDEASALRLLTHARTPDSDEEREAADNLARDLGYHALALELAAVAVSKRGFAAFRTSLDSPSRDAMDFASELLRAGGQSLPHRSKANLNLSQTLLQSVNGLPENARDVLRLAAQLAPVSMSAELIAHTLGNADSLEKSEARDAADIAMTAVTAQSLAREPNPGTVLVHTLVARAVRFCERDNPRCAVLRQASLPALEALLGNDICDVRLHPGISDAIAHSRVALAGTFANPAQAGVPELGLLDALQLFDGYHGNYEGARRGAECLIEYSRAQLGSEHLHTLLFMSRLGHSLHRLGDYRGAMATQEQILAVSIRTLGETDPHTLSARSDIAALWRDQGELARARSLREQVLAARRQVQGEQHESTLTEMHNLASTLSGQGEFASALSLERRVVEGRRTLLGPDHTETRVALGQLAVILRDSGNLSEAREIQEALVSSNAGAVEEDDPFNLTLMNDLAASLFSEGSVPKARELLGRVLILRTSRLGETHPDTLATMNNAAVVMIAQKDYASASPLLERSVALCRTALGPTHPETFKAAWFLTIALAHANGSGDRVRKILNEDLAPLIDVDPNSLGPELRDIQQRLRVVAAAKQHAAKPWWRRIF